MVRRIDVTGADGIRLAAWDFTDPPKPAGGPGGGGPGSRAGAADPRDAPRA
ncbi:alpha/beta fold hydrolase, partial [Streptomyces sp. URMC 123]